MKAALSIVLAGLLVTLPIKQVLAQAVQQEVGSEQRTAPPDGHRLIGVPPVTDNTSRLWSTPSDRALLDTELSDAPFVQWEWFGGLSPGAKVVVVLVVIVVVAVAAVLLTAVCDNTKQLKTACRDL